MTDHDKLDRLITRKLDGELTPEEALELDKILIRYPAAQQQLEGSARIDALAASVISEACSGEVHIEDLFTTDDGRRRRWLWIGLPAAAAACLTLVVGYVLLNSAQSPDGPGSRAIAKNLPLERPRIEQAAAPQWLNRQDQMPYREVDTQSTYYGVHDADSGRTYLLELRRTGRMLRPRPLGTDSDRGRVVLTSGDM